jgi:hypothetical protein
MGVGVGVGAGVGVGHVVTGVFVGGTTTVIANGSDSAPRETVPL